MNSYRDILSTAKSNSQVGLERWASVVWWWVTLEGGYN